MSETFGKITVEKNVNGIEGLHVVTPSVFGDARGYFMEEIGRASCRERV